MKNISIMTKLTQDIIDILITVENSEDPLPLLWEALHHSLSPQERKILHVLRHNSWKTTSQICDELDRPANHLGVILNRLYHAGLIIKHKRVTPTGNECTWQSKIGITVSP